MPRSTSRRSWDKADVVCVCVEEYESYENGSEFDAFKLATHVQEPSLGVPPGGCPGGLPGGHPGVPPRVPGTRWMLSVCVRRNMKSYMRMGVSLMHSNWPHTYRNLLWEYLREIKQT